MLQGLAKVLGWQRFHQSKDTGAVTCAATDYSRQQPTPDDSERVPAPTRHGIPTTQARPAADHAAALLTWLQGAGGRSGSILASELQDMHRELCHELDREPVGWVAVGRELRRILGTRKDYTRRAGRQVCVYRISPALDRVSGD